jgi:fido (protein-threonine AMPylation protein)
MPSEKPKSPDLTSEEAQAKWELLQSIGLKADVESLAMYQRRLNQGIEGAKRFLEGEPVHEPTPEMLKQAHKIVYSGLFNWAGEFRQPGLGFVESEQSRNPAVPGAHWSEIEKQMQKLCQQCAAGLKQEDIALKADAMATFHHGFEAAHSFVIGNGVVGRLVLDAHARQQLNHESTVRLDKPEYLGQLALMDVGAAKGELRDHILGATGQTPSLQQADRDIAAMKAANEQIIKEEAKIRAEQEQQREQQLDKLTLTPDRTIEHER